MFIVNIKNDLEGCFVLNASAGQLRRLQKSRPTRVKNYSVISTGNYQGSDDDNAGTCWVGDVYGHPGKNFTRFLRLLFVASPVWGSDRACGFNVMSGDLRAVEFCFASRFVHVAPLPLLRAPGPWLRPLFPLTQEGRGEEGAGGVRQDSVTWPYLPAREPGSCHRPGAQWGDGAGRCTGAAVPHQGRHSPSRASSSGFTFG